MSFDAKLFEDSLVQHYCNRLGWANEQATRAARIAIDVLRLTHGGTKHYIQARVIDHHAINADHRSGNSITELAQKYGITARHIRNIIR